MYMPEMLKKHADQIADLDVGHQEVPFRRGPWEKHIETGDLAGIDIGDIFDGLLGDVINRNDLFVRAPDDPERLRPCESADVKRWIRFFLLVMIWGYGDGDRRGPWRVNQMLHTPGFLDILCQAGEECFYGMFLKAYKTLHSIKQVGPAYASKLLYFYCHNFNAVIKPLIFDSVVVSTMLTFDWPDECVDFLASGTKPKDNAHAYGQYLILMHNWAHALHCTPDQLEYFMWGKGMGII